MDYQKYIAHIRSIAGADVYIGWSFVHIGDKLAVHVDGSLTATQLRQMAGVLDDAQTEENELRALLEEVTKS